MRYTVVFGRASKGSETLKTDYARKQRGFLAAKTYANGDSLSYTYTPGGKLKTRTGGRGIVTIYSYDPASGQLLTTDYADNTPDIVNSFDSLGRLTQAGRGGIIWDYTYVDTETSGYLVSTPDRETMNLDLDADGNIDFTRSLKRGFDALTRLNQVSLS